MRIEIKLTGRLYEEIIRDLAQPHPFAEERVGFVSGRPGSLSNGGRLILVTRYHSIPDDQYVKDPGVSARIGSEALIWAMQAVYRGRRAREGIFHIHMHNHKGETDMSWVDSQEIPKLMPGFQSVGWEGAHGIIILTPDHGSGWVWISENQRLIPVESINVIGIPLKVYKRRVTR